MSTPTTEDVLPDIVTKKLAKTPSSNGMKGPDSSTSTSSTTTNNNNAADEPIIKEGMVLKCGRKITSTWKRRYLVLRPTTLSYHAGENASVGERRYIEISQGTVVEAKPDIHPFCFQVRTPGFRKITARAKNQEDLVCWIAAIQEVISRAPVQPIRVVVVGDEYSSGKNVLVENYINLLDRRSGDGSRVQTPHGQGVIPTNSEKTRFMKSPDELLITDVLLEIEQDQFVKLGLWNTDGRDRFSGVRLLAYPHTDLFVLTFSTTDVAPFELIDTFVKEIKSKVTSPMLMLVGTIPSGTVKKTIDFDMAKLKAESLGCVGYVEARLESPESCEEVFSHAVRVCVEKKSGIVNSNNSINAQSNAVGRASGSGRVMGFQALAAALRSKTKKGSGNNNTVIAAPSPTNRIVAAGSTSSIGGTGNKGQAFFGKDELLINTTASSSSVNSNNNKPTTTTTKPEDGDDSDEGSLIGVEIDEADELMTDKDFGFGVDHVDDPTYLKKVTAKAEKAATSGISTSSRSRMLQAPLGEIAEHDAEEMEEQMEEMRRVAEKKEKELRAVRQTLDSLKNQNREVEEQLASMKKLMEELRVKDGSVFGSTSLPVAITTTTATTSTAANNNNTSAIPSTTPGLPPLPPSSSSTSTTTANTGTGTFFTRAEIRSRYAQSGRSASVFF
jgi:GTPase SAR1 family protein